MGDLIKVAAIGTGTYFALGFGQIHYDAESKDKAKSNPEIPLSALDIMVAEGRVKAPAGYQTKAEREAATKAAIADAQSDGKDATDLADMTERAEAAEAELAKLKEGATAPDIELAGYTMTAGDGGWFTLSGPEGFKPEKLQGEANAKTRFAELVAEAATAPTEPGADGSNANDAPAS